MESPKSKSPVSPGLEESIHPDLGNGALWESELHAYTLKSVDPSKSLEAFLTDPANLEQQIDRWKEDWMADQATRDIPADLEEPVSPERSIMERPLTEIIPAVVQTSEPAVESAEPVVKKGTTRPGKRVRKIVAEAERQEEEKRKTMQSPETQRSESGLSSYTQWLKGLKGSEYVHPYEDDFAFLQSEGPVKEGISETFADLLAAQGYKEQAIGMYKRLMEKFPEKSRFFAAKIEALL